MRGSSWVGAALALLGACGPSENAFVSGYVTSYCDYYLACSDPALAVFDGIDTVDDCQNVFGPPVVEASGTCRLNREAARDCLMLLDGLGCSGDPLDVDAGLPAECGMVWEQCVPGEDGEEEG